MAYQTKVGVSQPVYLTPGLTRYPAGINIDAPLDAFNRIRVSDPVTVFDAGHQYNINPLVWDTALSVNGTVTHLPNESSALLSTTDGTNGNKAIIQSRAYHRYQPGKSQFVLMTGVFGAATPNVRRRLGYFDASNGVFFEQTAAGMSVKLRTNTSGTPTDASIAQASWNLDKLDGTGPSGITADWTKAQIFVFDLEWLGVGRVRYGLVLGGQITYVHQITHINTLAAVYMTTANLPVRAEIENTAEAAAESVMRQICASVISEGGQEDDRAFLFGAANGITTVGVTTRRAVLSIRPKLLFNSLQNRAQVVPFEIDLYSDSNAFYEIVLNGALGGTPSWASANDASVVEVDVAGTTVTGGTVLGSGFVTTSGGASRGSGRDGISGRLPLGLNAAGNAADVLSVVVTSFTGTTNVSASVNWREFR